MLSALSTVQPIPRLQRLQVKGLLRFYIFYQIVSNIYIIFQMLARSPGKSGKGGGGGLPSVTHDVEFGGLTVGCHLVSLIPMTSLLSVNCESTE